MLVVATYQMATREVLLGDLAASPDIAVGRSRSVRMTDDIPSR